MPASNADGFLVTADASSTQNSTSTQSNVQSPWRFERTPTPDGRASGLKCSTGGFRGGEPTARPTDLRGGDQRGVSLCLSVSTFCLEVATKYVLRKGQAEALNP